MTSIDRYSSSRWDHRSLSDRFLSERESSRWDIVRSNMLTRIDDKHRAQTDNSGVQTINSEARPNQSKTLQILLIQTEMSSHNHVE